MQVRSRGFCTVASIVFAAVAVVQAWRAATGFPIQIGHQLLPVAASWGVALIATTLAAWGWRSR